MAAQSNTVTGIESHADLINISDGNSIIFEFYSKYYKKIINLILRKVKVKMYIILMF